MLKKVLLATAIAVGSTSAAYAQDNPFWPGLTNEQINEALERGDPSALVVKDDDSEVALGTPVWEQDVDSDDNKCYWRLYWQVEYKDHTVHWRSRMVKIPCSEPPPKSFSNIYLQSLNQTMAKLNVALDQGAGNTLLNGPPPPPPPPPPLSCPPPGAPYDPNWLTVKIMDDGDSLIIFKNGISLRCRGTKIIAVVASSAAVSLPPDNGASDRPNQEYSRSTRPKTDSKSDTKTGQSGAKSSGDSGRPNAKSPRTVERAYTKSETTSKYARRAVATKRLTTSSRMTETTHTSGMRSMGRDGAMHGSSFGGLGRMGIHLGGLSGFSRL